MQNKILGGQGYENEKINQLMWLPAAFLVHGRWRYDCSAVC